MSDKPNIHQRILAVMRRVSYVKKDKEVTGAGSYMAVTHDMVTAMVRPHFVENGIIIVPRLVSCEVVDTGRTTKSGTPILRYQGRYEVSFVNADDPQDTITVPVAAHAEDSGDKAPGKALSYATKFCVLKVLMLETGDDDEGRISESAPEPLSEHEIAGMKKNLDAAKDRKMLRKLLQEAFGLTTKAKDRAAHDAIKSYASELSTKLPEGDAE